MKDKIKESQIEKIRNHYKDHFDVQFLISEIDRLKENNDKLMTWAKNALVGAKHEACKYTEDDPDTTWHCCNWSEVVEEAERIGVILE